MFEFLFLKVSVFAYGKLQNIFGIDKILLELSSLYCTSIKYIDITGTLAFDGNSKQVKYYLGGRTSKHWIYNKFYIFYQIEADQILDSKFHKNLTVK